MAHLKPYQETSPSPDAQEVMKEASIIGRQALADFFTAMTAQKAHWYSIASCSFSDSSGTLINQVFPPIQTLLSIDPEIMNTMLQQCRLSLVRRGISSPNMNSWHTFIAVSC